LENKSTVLITCARVAVNYCLRDYIWVVRGNALYGDDFAEKVYIAVAGAGVYAGEDIYSIPITGIFDCGLDIVEIRGAIVIDDDYFRATRTDQNQPHQEEYQPLH